MMLFLLVDGYFENIIVINLCFKIYLYFFFDNVKVSMFEICEFFEYVKKNVYVVM